MGTVIIGRSRSTKTQPIPADRLFLSPAAAVWIALALAICIKTGIAPLSHTTYPCFEAGTRCWWADLNMYDFEACRFEYRYSPTFAVAFTPFALLPTWCGGMVWSLLNIAVLWWSLAALVRDVFPARWTVGQHALFHVLVALGSVRGLWAAQTNTLIFALVAGGAVAVARQRWWTAALFLAMPVYIKVWPLAAALLFIACWPRKLAGRFAGVLGGLALVPFLTKPPAVVAGHYQQWWDALSGPMQVRHVYRDAWTIWELVHPPVSPTGYLMLQLGTATAVLVLCLWQRWSGGRYVRDELPAGFGETGLQLRQTLTFILGIWTAWQLLFGPGTERNTIGLIAPLTSWALIMSCDIRRGRLLAFAAFALTTLFSFGLFERLLEDSFPPALAALPMGVLLFAVWLIAAARIIHSRH